MRREKLKRVTVSISHNVGAGWQLSDALVCLSGYYLKKKKMFLKEVF